MKKVKALVLLSGGLDSILAVKVLTEQGIEVTGVAFESYFFNAGAAKKAAEKLGIELKIVDFSEDHLRMLKSPKYGYGKTANPCIDCHILMLKMAKKIMEKESFDFVATGEVLGERPMSQNKEALVLIKKESSLSGYLLRPLSAKLLEKTIPEKKGLVNRDKLLDISGRSRKRQISLAEKWNIKEYPTPAGGCLLTDLEFSKKVKDLFKICPRCRESDIHLLRYGRHFWKGEVKVIVGRDEEENKQIKKLKKKRDVLIEMKNYPGPLTLVRSYGGLKVGLEVLEFAKKITKYYSTKARSKKDVKFRII